MHAHDTIEQSAIERLRAAFAGEVYDDRLQRRLHAADASLYQELPQLVARPRSAEDIAAALRWASEQRLPVTARTAGTSLAGQATGGGMILDCSRHLTAHEAVEVGAARVRCEPGVILDDLNDAIAATGLFFAPDTSTSNRCMIGGMIANNSCGSHSCAYGTTREHVLAIDAVLSDGSPVRFEALDDAGFRDKLAQDDREGAIYRELDAIVREHRQLILDRYPRPAVSRRNTGYCLDALANMRPWDPDGEPCNLAKLLCGSEGTLALTVAAELNLIPRPRHRLLVAVHFHDVISACRAAVVAVRHRCHAAELIDDIILQATKDNFEQRRNRAWVQGDPGAILAIELEDGDQQSLQKRMDELIEELREQGLGHAWPVLRDGEIGKIWNLRKAGLGLLMGIVSERKAWPVIEDAAVAPDDLPDYVAAVNAIMRKHETRCVHYAHAAAGELHLRPELDLRDPVDARRFRAIAEEVADLLARFRGSLSGEHGDGRVRSPMIARVLGDDVVALLRRVKRAFDPLGILNPGKIVDPEPLEQDWRVHPGMPEPTPLTSLDWSADGGLLRATERCNGVGACRKSPGRGTMCPSYHVTREELHSTRGRANLFRQLLLTEDPRAVFTSDELKQAMQLCLGCKACVSECPANVDLARLKAEFSHQRHRRLGIPRADRLFGRFARQARLARWAPTLASRIAGSAFGKRFAGIDARRSVPAFAARSFTSWWRRHRAAEAPPSRQLALFVDEFAEHLEPGIAIAAVELLEAAGYQVHAIVGRESGRSQISRGLLDEAAVVMQRSVDALLPHAHRRRPILGLEPSAILGFADEAPDLLGDARRADAELVGAQVVLLEDFLVAEHAAGRLGALRWRDERPRRALLHGHCHQKALVGCEGSAAALALIPDCAVEIIGSGCCGMAGSFGYQHYDVSMAIGEQILFPAVRAADERTVIAAPGTSCRHQIADGTGRLARHPVQVLRDAVAGSR